MVWMYKQMNTPSTRLRRVRATVRVAIHGPACGPLKESRS